MNKVPEKKAGHELFIVDNSVEGWTGLRYLEEWTKIAKSFDIATGYFEIGALLALDGKWQELEKLRILMGDETTARTRRAILEAVRSRATQILDQSLEIEKTENPFLEGVPAILDALKSGQIETRVFDRDKFHAKAYITHAKLEVVGAQALVGSSNFTAPGLTKNVELNVQIQSAREVAQLQEWFDEHWDEATEIDESVIETVSRHTELFTPFDVYAKSLQELFKGHELTDTEWDETKSEMFPQLDQYQREAYWALMKIARQHGGAFLCDGVGLGKTFVGLMLIERLIRYESKNVLLFAPKAAKEGVWEPHLKDWLPSISGADFSNLALFSHTDLNRKGDYPERFERLAEQADVVIIDEAHHFRNPGRQENAAKGIEPSRYHKLFELLDNEKRKKTVFFLTATPINNRLSDFRHMAELFTRREESYFGRTLGVNNFRSHFANLEKTLHDNVGHDVTDISEYSAEAQDILSGDAVFKELVVQRSRSYARESQIREKGEAAAFPERKPPQVAEYSVRKTYGRLLDMVEKAFQKNNPLFTLPMYYPLRWYIGSDETIDPFEEGRQKQVVGLIRTQFLKRFESSVAAFELSCDRLMKKLMAFVEVHSDTAPEKERFARWQDQNAEILGYAAQRQKDIWGDVGDDIDEEDVIPPELLDQVERDKLNRDEYNVPEMLAESYLDLDEITKFVAEARRFEPQHDDKLRKLKRLLKFKALDGEKVLIFTEFADTARYLNRQLSEDGIDGVFAIDGGTKGNRADIIRRFAPYYNRSSSGALKAADQSEIRVLISTDVLSEGLNLQDASRMINYDIHWNPVRLMQRIGRVDRRMNPEIEKQLIADHPHFKESRGIVHFWNFLPPDELNEILTLYSRVTQKTLLISRTLGIEGRKLLKPDDDYEALKEFNEAYEGHRTAVEDLHLEYQDFLKADADLEPRLTNLPGAIFSGRKMPSDGVEGVFLCYALPAFDKEAEEFTEEAGTTRWYFYDLNGGSILDEPGEIADLIRSDKKTERHCALEKTSLIEVRGKIEKHIKETHLKRVDAPIGVKPSLKCWMELNKG